MWQVAKTHILQPHRPLVTPRPHRVNGPFIHFIFLSLSRSVHDKDHASDRHCPLYVLFRSMGSAACKGHGLCTDRRRVFSAIIVPGHIDSSTSCLGYDAAGGIHNITSFSCRTDRHITSFHITSFPCRIDRHVISIPCRIDRHITSFSDRHITSFPCHIHNITSF